MADARKTGISSITGKMVYIRHAGDFDRVNISEYCARHNVEVDATVSDAVVAVEDERLIGFGILEGGGAPDGRASLTVRESGRRRGIGAPILRHLMEYTPVKSVLADRESAAYLARLGFRRMRTGPGRNSIYQREDQPS